MPAWCPKQLWQAYDCSSAQQAAKAAAGSGAAVIGRPITS